jgi:hypothetical protein
MLPGQLSSFLTPRKEIGWVTYRRVSYGTIRDINNLQPFPHSKWPF